MSWNRPTETHAAARTAVRRPVLRLLGLLAVLSVIVGVSLFFVFQGPEAPDAKVTAKGVDTSRVETTNSVSTTRPSSVRTVRKSVTNVLATVAKPDITKAAVFLEPMKRHVTCIERVPAAIFTNVFENFVAEVISAEPGVRFLETDLGIDFDKSFIESLNDKIEILPEDDENVVAIKKAVIEAKEKVADEVRRGRLPREVVLEARDEMNKIADFRDDLQNKVNEFMCEEDDPAEVMKFMNEANEVLKEYSSIPLEGPDDEEMALEQMQIQRDLKEEREKEAELLRIQELEKKAKKETES